MGCSAVSKDTGLADIRQNSKSEAAPSGEPVQRSPAGQTQKDAVKEEDMKGCLMCGTCGMVGYCILD